VDETACSTGLIDTDILIDAARGLPDAGVFLNRQQQGEGILISVISSAFKVCCLHKPPVMSEG
jgi:hypothetical protein